MSERMLIPERGRVYLGDDYNNIGQSFTINATQYVFVKVPAGVYIRKGTAVYTDVNYLLSVVQDVTTPIMHMAAWDIDTIGPNANGYTLVVESGDVTADAAPKAKTSCYYNSTMVQYDNGVSRSVNASTVIGTGLLKMAVLSQVVSLCASAEQNYVGHVSMGDFITTNLGHYTTVGSVVNGSSIITTFCGSTYANDVSYSASVVFAAGTQLKGDKLLCTSASYTSRSINSSTLPVTWGVNVCTASTIFFCNTNVVGSMVKVGDLINIAGDTGYSYRIVTSLQNANAFTVNAAATAETYGNLGTKFNVNYFTVLARITAG